MINIPPDIEQLIDQHLATGLYSTPEDVLRSALEQLNTQTLTALTESLADEVAGRDQSLSAVGDSLRQKYGFEKSE